MHAFASSHPAPTARRVSTHSPDPASHATVAHDPGPGCSQDFGTPPLHAPASHTSSMVHALSSSHALPLAVSSATTSHAPDLHDTTWHAPATKPAAKQSLANLQQLPAGPAACEHPSTASQLSTVQASPSSQLTAVHSVADIATSHSRHWSNGWMSPFCQHSPPNRHVPATGVLRHAPVALSHVSSVHARPSSHSALLPHLHLLPSQVPSQLPLAPHVASKMHAFAAWHGAPSA